MTPDERYEQFRRTDYEWQQGEVERLKKALLRFKSAAQKFVEKVDTGRAHSRETYREMKEALDGCENIQL